ncbi:NADPH-dependent F420 reductase [Flavobacterium sp. JAS]|uniref:NADPH-dependent F420 reductase n=1 Tax=Flavobacterium sp. JAS TaxID=2897329 RepID=UPI001E292A4A|nr:NAD(P)-binding domain-containing protein [Flavobacterium sp. JAS]MCD0470341.1 NAD(P)-binding domain-containing protein [Flavobacterium sp. JAS]
MRIGVIGAGPIGRTLIRQYALAGHDIKMANANDAEKLKKLEAETGAKAVTLEHIAVDIDVLVVSVPLVAIPELAKSLGKSIPADTVVIDTTNYYPIRDGVIDEIEEGIIESVWVANHLGHPVVKAYNSILAGSLLESGLPEGNPDRIALSISGNDEQAKSLVATLINDSGFDTMDAGNLEGSWRQQPGSPVYCTDLNLAQLKKNIFKANREVLPERRELSLQFIIKQDPEQWMVWWKNCVTNNRSIFECNLIA